MLLFSTVVQKGGVIVNITNEKTMFQNDLDNRICSHISRGNMEAYRIISTYHMSEIYRIRDYILDVLHTDYLYDARALNAAFHMAISELGINLESLLKEGTQIVSSKKQVIRLSL